MEGGPVTAADLAPHVGHRVALVAGLTYGASGTLRLDRIAGDVAVLVGKSTDLIPLARITAVSQFPEKEGVR